ncbi:MULTISPECIES: FGGY-family carbohydrate kinase [Inquilinus]|uniref:Sugar (Pentulose or hexulose) kinase n=1 Tax=Inquilinus ginsengisoli TaxID=363840 RepID=A0ABU1JX05_9PROT|nr:FGGY family carbohydrate kinase [Inquilinus ginsengisoli]MDR6292080.1 sugar (pentulose or hexulose) kinase [Inquilinus ginsengisoli]
MSVVAVLDVGKTNLKLLAVTPEGAVLEAIRARNLSLPGPPYLRVDLAAIEAWLLRALGELARRHRLSAFVATGYGSSGVLVDETGPALPMLDYETEAPDWLHDAYAAEAPGFAETGCAIGAGAQRLAKQLLWLERDWPEGFARARHLLALPQYFAWRLGGVAASEITTLAAQTHLWNPQAGDVTAIVDRRSWRRLIPPRRNAWDVLGTIRPDLAAAHGLPTDLALLCGVHDSNANYHRFLAAGLGDVPLLSTGTWIIGFRPGLALDRLDGRRGMVANVDVDGRPIGCTLHMGGREWERIAGEGPADASTADVAALVAAGTLALPGFADSDGLFPGRGGRGEILGPPPQGSAARSALATLYTALCCATALDLLDARDRVIVDGGFAANPLFAPLLAALRPGHRVEVSAAPDGSAVGAALLWARHQGAPPATVALLPAPPLAVPGLAAYAERWRSLTGAPGRPAL